MRALICLVLLSACASQPRYGSAEWYNAPAASQRDPYADEQLRLLQLQRAQALSNLFRAAQAIAPDPFKAQEQAQPTARPMMQQQTNCQNFGNGYTRCNTTGF